MVDFRRMIPVLAVLAFLLGSAVTASAQANPPLQCVTAGAINTPVRSEGLTELVGDIQITCQGGVPIAVGQPIPPVTVQIFLNTAITSRCMSSTSAGCIGAYTEALLMLDEPTPAQQFGCAATTCANVGNGTGAPSYGNGVLGVGTNKNIFQAIQSTSNSITFQVPIDPPGTTGQRIIRITNIRANANALGVAGANAIPFPVNATITTTPFNSLPIGGLAQQAVGSVQTGLSFSVRKGDGSGDTLDNPFIAQQCLSKFDGTPGANTQIAFLRYKENFNTAFKKRSYLASDANRSITSVQNSLTAGVYNSETGFTPVGTAANLPAASVNGLNIGDADWGTRLKATFNNIPNGIRLYVDSSATFGTDIARLTRDETLGWSLVSGTRVELTITNNSASAVWEILDSDPTSLATLQFGVYLRYAVNTTSTPASPALGTGTVSGSYAPVSTATTATQTNIPRFRDTGSPVKLLIVVPCATNLLFPFVTSQFGYDTGIAISNTSTDPAAFGTSPQTGPCTLNWFGAAFTGATPMPGGSIASGTTAATLVSTALSTVAGGFQGYMIAVCQFQYAHGFAFAQSRGTEGVAVGYLALVIPDPPTPRGANPFTLGGANSGEQL